METVKTILDRKGSAVDTIEPDAMVLDAAQQMNEHRIGSLLVMHEGRLKGIVTERDILRRVVAGERDPAHTRVREIMTPMAQIKHCLPETPLDDCRALMSEKRIRHLPVLVGERVVGIITIGDLMAQQIEAHATTIDYLHAYVESSPGPIARSA